MFKCWTDEMLESVLLNKYWTEDFRKVQEFAKAEIARRKKEKAMKAYKIDLSMYPGKVREAVSEAVQKHGEILGYDTKSPPKDAPWLYFDDDDGITWLSYDDRSLKNVLITASDFLALESAKDEPVFKPFDKVLRRDGDDDIWNADLFSHKGDPAYPYFCTASCFKQCIPYEGNEHLLGTTDSK